MRNNQRNIFAVLLILWSCAIGGNVLAQTAPYKMWYDKPAQFWEEALPIGNGRISAMVYGDPYTGRFQLNEELSRQVLLTRTIIKREKPLCRKFVN